MKKKIVIVTAAYGHDQVKTLGGQANLLPIIAAAGADGVEIRRELLTEHDISTLPELAKHIVNHGLFCIYSVPEPLFSFGGELNANLPMFIQEAAQLGAQTIKLSLGHFKSDNSLNDLKILLKKQTVRLIIENDQTAECGILSQLNAFFYAVEELRLPLSMAFDMANWLWVGQEPFAAADRLARHVGYIHVKAANLRQNKWQAIALDNSDGSWQPLLEKLPTDVPRGIEFPLQGSNLTAVTRHYVDLLRAN